MPVVLCVWFLPLQGVVNLLPLLLEASLVQPVCNHSLLSFCRAISGMWNLGQKGGGKEGVSVEAALAAGKLASSQRVGGQLHALPMATGEGPATARLSLSQ